MMTIDSTQLLRQLEPVVRPGLSSTTVAPARPGLADQSFDELLALASRGAIQSGRQVQLTFEPNEALDDQQITRLSAAADLAQASGAKQAMALIDGRGFVLDVEQRTLTAELSASAGSRVIPELDAAIYVPSADEQETETLGPPAARMPPPAVARQIASAQSAALPDTGRASTINQSRSPASD